MQKEISDIVLEIRGNKELFVVDEASIKAGVVLRVLQALGWDPFNVDEVTPEYSVEGRRVDISLRTTNANKVFIEVKRPRENLEGHQEQLLSYSFAEGVKLAVLTNGMTWWLYLPLSEGSWEQRRFYSLDLLEQDPADVARRFEDFLAKARVISGEAVRTAEQVYMSRQKKSVLRESIPKAWTKLITDPDDLLVELLIETTEKLCGFRPEMVEIEAFLERLSDGRSPASPTEESPTQRQRTMAPRSRQTHSTREMDFIGKGISSIALFGRTYQPKTWQELLLTVANEVYRRHPQDFSRCLYLKGSKMAYFSKNPSELSSPKQIADSEFYAEVKLNSNSIVRRSRELLGLWGYVDSDLQITAK